MRWGTFAGLGLLVGGCGAGGTSPTFAVDSGGASLEASAGVGDAGASTIDAATARQSKRPSVDASADATMTNVTADAAADVDAASDGRLIRCSIVLASDYDQSCATDDDCALVGQVSACPPTECSFCPMWSINTSALARYQADIADDRASVPPGQQCGCPAEGFPCCRGGRCQQNGGCFFPSTDTLPACVNAGGVCTAARFGCLAGVTPGTNAGPPNSCAFSDEVCCVP
jgi:hypothetical protein